MKNNWQKGKIILDKIERSNTRPSILLHSCCGPCSTYPIELLYKYFDITIMFNNSNIYPLQEYNLRLSELKRYVDIFNRNNNCNIKIITTDYNNEEYSKNLFLRKNDKEKGPRCRYCYAVRMRQAFQYAYDNKFDYCGTVMSMSRQKDEQAINQIGQILEKQFSPVKFLIHNFKKKGGQERREELVHLYNIYDQDYCGCKISLDNK